MTLATTFDLLIIPHLGYTLPAPHLTPQAAAQAHNDWKTATNTTTGKVWTIAIAHETNPHQLAITSTLTIPRT